MSVGKLPAGWVITTFTELLDVQGGTQPPKSEFISEMQDGYVRLLQIRDFGNKPVPTYIPDKSKLKKCKEEDLLIGRYGASLGRICTGHAGAYNVALAKVIIPKQLERAFVRYYLKSEVFQFPLRLLSRSAQNGFNKDDLSKFDFVLVPLSEQKIIAEKLDTLLAQVDSTKARLEQIPQILKRFRQAVLTFAMNGELTKEWRSQNNNPAIFSAEKNSLKEFRNNELPSIPNNWSWMRFDQVADIASKLKSPLDYPNTIHLAPNHIESWTGKASGYQTILEDGVTSAKHEFYTGQIIYSKIRPYLCKVTIATFDGMCSADMYPINSKIDTHFLFRWMLTNTFTDWASNAESRTVLPKINQKDLSEIPVPTPPLPEQHEIVRRVEQLFAYADTIEKQVNNALARVNNLTQSILAKAFRGELTAQWRAENPDLISGENSAAALLEKIKAERTVSGGKKASRKKL